MLEREHTQPVSQIGGKGKGLLTLMQAGSRVPTTVCITGEAYDCMLDSQGLREKIALALNRKQLGDMRWEEIWDTALRIQALFLAAPLPTELHQEMTRYLEKVFGGGQVAVRSSATDEDQLGGSFAGLHESLLNVPVDQVIRQVKKVWASLWSDKALLYRQELGLTVETSRMAVVVQQMMKSEVSGVCFTRDPMGSDQMVVEAVYGLNQGLVDGRIEPDRWFLDRSSGKVMEWGAPANRRNKTAAIAGKIVLEEIPPTDTEKPPLDQDRLHRLWKECQRLEHYFGYPLDVEWTFSQGQLEILQARPISTLADAEQGDKRPWYLSLHRSYDNLIELRRVIEEEVLPAMEREAAAFARCDPATLDDHALAAAIEHRLSRTSHWTDVYWQECIPFAHGVRLFGEIYNELLTPEDPYEFIQLLSSQQMLSTHRNTLLQRLADHVREDEQLRRELEQSGIEGVRHPQFRRQIKELKERFGLLLAGKGQKEASSNRLLTKLIFEYARLPRHASHPPTFSRDEGERRFLHHMGQSGYPFSGEELLELARASYRLRDDDNIYLGKVEQQLEAAVIEGRHRLIVRGVALAASATPAEVADLLAGRRRSLPVAHHGPQAESPVSVSRVRARQLVGQPAAKGVAKGVARVILKTEELHSFQAGEILVVDSIDPNMTFVAPLAAAIVERRGGMLIHGAIIAREYGIPCITGIPDVTDLVTTGDRLTVDGYLGIVTVDQQS